MNCVLRCREFGTSCFFDFFKKDILYISSITIPGFVQLFSNGVFKRVVKLSILNIWHEVRDKMSIFGGQYVFKVGKMI